MKFLIALLSLTSFSPVNLSWKTSTRSLHRGLCHLGKGQAMLAQDTDFFCHLRPVYLPPVRPPETLSAIS